MEGKNVIIKRARKKGHGGGHGGSWKVAYADFVTAMMAFFLLLWLITMVSPEKKAKVSHYFRYFSIFEKSGASLADTQNASPPIAGTSPIPELISEDEIKGDASPATAQFEEKMKVEMETRLSEFKEQIMVVQFDGGVRLELLETEGRPMFPSGRNELTPEGKKILQVITENLQQNNSKIAIEGHTDAKGFASNRYSNWELSTERASAARKELEKNGLGPDRLVRIAGLAATQPLIRDNPDDPRNRRISILLFGEPSSTHPAGIKGTGKLVNPVPAQASKKIRPGNLQFDPVEQYLVGGR
ncbi:MAG: chemotaxis protein [Deltaproteobacteria bacterium HGW-Deltaproteobacteria-21]|nr:MAG: chemotaxis protein [Deltaproteobacteria bacterium HGW-Deltaproteobacteria-21]